MGELVCGSRSRGRGSTQDRTRRETGAASWRGKPVLLRLFPEPYPRQLHSHVSEADLSLHNLVLPSWEPSGLRAEGEPARRWQRPGRGAQREPSSGPGVS